MRGDRFEAPRWASETGDDGAITSLCPQFRHTGRDPCCLGGDELDFWVAAGEYPVTNPASRDNSLSESRKRVFSREATATCHSQCVIITDARTTAIISRIAIAIATSCYRSIVITVGILCVYEWGCGGVWGGVIHTVRVVF